MTPELSWEAPKRTTATEVLANVLARLRDHNVRYVVGASAISQQYGRRCRFTAVLDQDGHVAVAVVVKSSPNAAKTMTRQRRRLESLGVPVVFVRGAGDVDNAVRSILGFVQPESPDADTDAFFARFEKL